MTPTPPKPKADDLAKERLESLQARIKEIHQGEVKVLDDRFRGQFDSFKEEVDSLKNYRAGMTMLSIIAVLVAGASVISAIQIADDARSMARLYAAAIREYSRSAAGKAAADTLSKLDEHERRVSESLKRLEAELRKVPELTALAGQIPELRVSATRSAQMKGALEGLKSQVDGLSKRLEADRVAANERIRDLLSQVERAEKRQERLSKGGADVIKALVTDQAFKQEITKVAVAALKNLDSGLTKLKLEQGYLVIEKCKGLRLTGSDQGHSLTLEPPQLNRPGKIAVVSRSVEGRSLRCRFLGREAEDSDRYWELTRNALELRASAGGPKLSLSETHLRGQHLVLGGDDPPTITANSSQGLKLVFGNDRGVERGTTRIDTDGGEGKLLVHGGLRAGGQLKGATVYSERFDVGGHWSLKPGGSETLEFFKGRDIVLQLGFSVTKFFRDVQFDNALRSAALDSRYVRTDKHYTIESMAHPGNYLWYRQNLRKPWPTEAAENNERRWKFRQGN